MGEREIVNPTLSTNKSFINLLRFHSTQFLIFPPSVLKLHEPASVFKV